MTAELVLAPFCFGVAAVVAVMLGRVVWYSVSMLAAPKRDTALVPGRTVSALLLSVRNWPGFWFVGLWPYLVARWAGVVLWTS